jgi:CRP/FNR family transcriptional regulator
MPPHPTSRGPFCAPPELFVSMQKLCQPQEYKAETVLFSVGDPPRGIFLIFTGAVRLTLPGQGNAKGFDRLAGPNCILGLPSTITNKPYSLRARVLEDAQLGFVPRSEVNDYFRIHPDICYEVLNVLAEEIRRVRLKLRPNK